MPISAKPVLRKTGCMEQIISLRLFCDYAIYKRVKLYVLYIDLGKAYDRVLRWKLVERLAALECGSVMLRADVRVHQENH